MYNASKKGSSLSSFPHTLFALKDVVFGDPFSHPQILPTTVVDVVCCCMPLTNSYLLIQNLKLGYQV
jgi:hypothetical protein